MLTTVPASPTLSGSAITGTTDSLSWGKEIKQLFSQKVLNIIWWPVFKYNQRYLTRSSFFKYCQTLTGFGSLWGIIQKGSFAYNSLFLRVRPYQKQSSWTNLADITTLALFFGDEFIDGLCETAGKFNILEVVKKDHEQFYLQRKSTGEGVALEYRFDLNELLPVSLMQEINGRYEISYQKFYSLLQYFLTLINHHLSRMPSEKADRVAGKIIAVCNSCLDSYFHDVNSNPVDEKIHTVDDVLQFHEVKTRKMQEKLLDLRCTLADKEYLMKTGELQGWLELMCVVQIIDDLEDAPDDDNIQDNLVISAAFHYFPMEWKWFCAHRLLLQKAKHKQLLLSLYMPQTISFCLQLASEKKRFMNWEQQKIMHYLLFRNWFKNNKGDIEFLPDNANRIDMPSANEQAIKSYLLDLCFHLHSGRKWIRKNIGWLEYYRLRYNLLCIPADEKATLFDKMTMGKTVEWGPALRRHQDRIA